MLRGSIRNSEAGLVKKAELSEALLKLEGRMAEGKAEVRTLREAAERGWSSAVREESVRRREATDKLSTRLKEEIDKLASNGRLDMNLERERAKEELSGRAKHFKQNCTTCVPERFQRQAVWIELISHIQAQL